MTAPIVAAGTCRVCGCSEDRACPGGCAWMDETKTLCTRCFAEKAPGIRKSEISPCATCGRPLTGAEGCFVTFYRITVERFLLLAGPVRRAYGEDLLMGPALAGVLGRDEELAKRFAEEKALVCESCAMEHPIVALRERIAERASGTQEQVGS